jgi:tripartite-type tricarboxylate transporter receptor subunit TctC
MLSLPRLFFIVLMTILPDLVLSQPSQNWPERTVRLISPSPPGGSPDIVARLFAEKLSMRWKVSVIVENRPGADGMIAIQAVLGATDGHTLLATHSGAVTVTPAIRKLPYNTEDLRPLSTAAIDFLAVAVPAASSVRTLADLIAAAREKPGALNWFASTGAPAMAFGEFVLNNRLDMVFVPYKGGTEAVRDLSESRIQVSLVPLAVALPLAQAGRLRLIAITNPESAPIAPDVPTASGAGHPELAIQGVLVSRVRRPYRSKVSAVSRKRWRMVPASSATSSRHSGPSLSLAMMSRIMSEHAIAASSHAASSSPTSTGMSLEWDPWRIRNV